MTGNHIFAVTHLAVLIWAAFVVWLAVVTKNPAWIGIFYVPALGLPALMRRMS